MDTLVLGGASWNRVLHLPELPGGQAGTLAASRSYEAAGSTGIGKALALKALGFDPVLHAAIGDDKNGAHIREFCHRRGLTTLFDVQDGPTAAHVNLMDPDGNRLSLMAPPDVPSPVVDTGRLVPLIAAARAVFVSITPSSVPLLPLVAETRAQVLVDLHDWDGRNPWHVAFLDRADIVQLSADRVADAPGLARRLLDGGAQMVVCTMGARGARIVTEGAVVDAAPVSARMVDSNGAGDVFSVALWAALTEGAALGDAGAYAAAAAALAVEARTLVPVSLTDAAIRARLAGA